MHAAELDCDSPPGGVSASFGDAHEFEDALGPERLGAEHLTWDGLLAAYDDERTSASVAVAELGRRIGRDQVEHTPEWGSMTPVDFETWTQQNPRGTAALLLRKQRQARPLIKVTERLAHSSATWVAIALRRPPLGMWSQLSRYDRGCDFVDA